MRNIVLLTSILLVIGCATPQQQVNEEKSNDAITTIMNRKSVRTFTSDTVSMETINTLLKAAMAAPSGMNVQPWSFVVLRDTSRYEQVFGDNFNMPIYKQSAAIVVFCADTTVTRSPRENPSAPAVTMANRIWRDDLGACTENFLIATEAMSLGAVWTACYPYAERMNPVREALNLPDNVVPYCVVPIGVPGGDEQPKDKWKPERIHIENW